MAKIRQDVRNITAAFSSYAREVRLARQEAFAPYRQARERASQHFETSGSDDERTQAGAEAFSSPPWDGSTGVFPVGWNAYQPFANLFYATPPGDETKILDAYNEGEGVFEKRRQEARSVLQASLRWQLPQLGWDAIKSVTRLIGLG